MPRRLARLTMVSRLGPLMRRNHAMRVPGQSGEGLWQPPPGASAALWSDDPGGANLCRHSDSGSGKAMPNGVVKGTGSFLQSVRPPRFLEESGPRHVDCNKIVPKGAPGA